MSQTRNAARNNDADTDPVNPATDRVAALANETIDRVMETANTAGQGVRSAAAKTAGAVKRAQDQTAEAAGEQLHKVRSYIERNPLTIVGIAFAAGALLSAWVRR